VSQIARCRAPCLTNAPLLTLSSLYVPGPQQLRQQEKREKKLEDIREQVAQGRLVIRQMTAAERKRFPPRAGSPPRRSSPRP
jgi:hypothetical protein